MVFSIFTELCNHHQYLIPKHFHHSPQKTSYPLAVTPHSPLLQPFVSTNLLSVLMDLPILDISSEWNHAICGLWCLV